MKITQIIHGYCDPNEYGVVVCFQVDRKEYGLYVEFNRKTRKLVAMRDEDPKRLPANLDLNAIEQAARAFVGNGWDA